MFVQVLGSILPSVGAKGIRRIFFVILAFFTFATPSLPPARPPTLSLCPSPSLPLSLPLPLSVPLHHPLPLTPSTFPPPLSLSLSLFLSLSLSLSLSLPPLLSLSPSLSIPPLSPPSQANMKYHTTPHAGTPACSYECVIVICTCEGLHNANIKIVLYI